MINGNPILTLLEKITSGQILDLIDEVHLSEGGYQFFYAMDNHDIRRFCFPGGFSGESFEYNADGKTINYELVTDIITGYDDFFNNISPQKPVFLLEEYTPELLTFKSEIISFIQHSNDFNYGEQFNEYLGKHFEKKSNISYDFTFFISVATGLLRNGVSRYNQLIQNECFFLHESDFAQSDLVPWYKNLYEGSFEENYQLHDKIYEIISGIRDYKRDLSSRIDSEVITRLIQINKLLLKEYYKEKKLILYLSSVNTSTSVFRRIRKSLPIIHGRPFRFHRTVEQLFLSRLFKDLDNKVKLERLDIAYKLALYREVNFERFRYDAKMEDKEFQKLEGKVLETFQDAWEKYIDANLSRPEQFKRITELRNQLDKLNKKISITNLKKLYKTLQKQSEEYISPEENLEYIENLERTFEISQIFTITFKTAYRKLIKGEPLEISRGNDKITGTGQHLPIVFLYDEKPLSGIFDKIAELYLDQFAFRSIVVNQDANTNLINEIKKMANKLFVEDFENITLQEKLIICLYLLILPDARIVANKTNDDHVEDFLLSVVRKGFDKGQEKLCADYLYALSWILRRNNKNPLALEYAEKGIEEFPDDARFYHSRFLINFCQMPDKLTPEDKMAEYKRHENDIHTAQEKYTKLLFKKSSAIKNNIILTLLNSEIYCDTLIISCKKSSTSDKRKALDSIRHNKLKQLKEIAGDNYINYPEFLHTEAFLELHESEFKSTKEEKIKKIGYAIDTLNKGIDKARILIGFKTESFDELLIELKNRLKKYSATV